MTREDWRYEHVPDGGLTDKVAIVTGAGSQGAGIGNGRAAAVLLARAGAVVCLVDAVESRLEETAQMIEDEGGQYLTVVADVAKPEDCENAVTAAIEAWDRLDVLVNNVGIIGPVGTVVDLDVDEWNRCMRANVNSMMLMSRFAVPRMKESGSGSIVNISSVAGLVGGAPLLAYSASKGAVNTLTKTMATQHGPDGIRVNAVAPGYVYTPIVVSQGLSEEDRELRRKAAPLGVEGTGWDVAEAVLYLAGSHSRWVTGAILTVDAGLTSVGIYAGGTRYSPLDQQ
jgi:NAD(P)-dependent dehydrogenase (short-subunit alcohol dehydrogenase family)